MPKKRGRRTQVIPISIGNDPTLWRYESLGDALAANVDLLAQLIREGRRMRQEELGSDADTIASAES